MRPLIFLPVLLASSPFTNAQYPRTCPVALPYTAAAISRSFDYCAPAFAYGASFAPNPTPYPTNQAACVNLCTGSCVAANWAEANNCQLAMGSLLYISTASFWNPPWTAYVVRTTPSTIITSSTSSSAIMIPTPQFTVVTPSPIISSSSTSISKLLSPSSILPIPTVLPSPSSLTASGFVVANTNNPTCPDSNSTTYTNAFGSQFTVYCALDLYDANPELRTVQPNFRACIDDCDRRFSGRCPGVTWISTRQWCFFKPSNTTLQPAADTVWSAVKLPGPDGVTCPQANGTIYTDGVYTDMLVDQFSISCGFELVDSTTSRRSAQLTFEACMNDCNEDVDCEGVTWRPNGEDQRWCYHKSKNALLKLSGSNYWSAQKIYNSVASSVSSSQSNTIPLSILGGAPTALLPASSTNGALGLSSVATIPVCPAGNQTIYTAKDRSTWRLDCNIDYSGNDWFQIQTSTLQECIDACASRGVSCSGVVNVPSRSPNCYLKSGVLSADRRVIQPFLCDSAVRLSSGTV